MNRLKDTPLLLGLFGYRYTIQLGVAIQHCQTDTQYIYGSFDVSEINTLFSAAVSV